MPISEWMPLYAPEVTMGRSSNRLAYSRHQAAELQRQAAAATEQSQLTAEVNSVLNAELGEINSRDTDQIREYLDAIEDAIRDRVEEFDRLRFGGSVAKHTHVDGLSDVDSLVVLDSESHADISSADARKEIADVLRARLGRDRVDRVELGNMAVTVRYRDGTEIQLLPAVERGERLRISTSDGTGWTKYIQPRRFAEKLRDLNNQQGRAMIPTIKLAKAVIANRLSESERLTGYHVETLAVKAFENYGGQKNLKTMLTHFFESASQHVRAPISDVTGQSPHVDEYLGAAESQERRRASGALAGIARTMRDTQSTSDWQRLLSD
jgi:hypothetical protein